jgi:hypothetical protein
MRIPLLAAFIIIASIQGCRGTDSAPSNSATSDPGAGAGAAPTPGAGAAPTPGAGAAPTPNKTSATLSCGSPQLTVGAPAADSTSLDVALNGNDKTQTFTSGSVFTIALDSVVPRPDVLNWQINNYAGTTITSGSINLARGATAASLQCTSTISGYFAVSAHLQNSRVTLPRRGSRPAGFATFGVLPNVEDLLPTAASAPLDRHRIGLQGSNFVEAGVCCNVSGLQPVNENLGSTWVLDSRSELRTEPNHAGQYNPATYRLDVGFKQGTLARIVTLNGIPSWASTAPTPTSTGSYPPKSLSAFQSYTALVGQESAHVQAEYLPDQQKNYYQVTWEPDPGPSTQWMGTDSEFVALYKAAWNGVHSTDPNAAVMGPTTTGITLCSDWLNRLAPLGFTKYLDAVSCHGYYTISASSAKPPEPANLPGQMQALRQSITNLLPSGTRLFITETGISYPRGSKYSPTFPTAEVLLQHAEAVVRTHLILLGEGADTSFLFYSADYSYEVGFGLYFNLSMPNPDFGSPNISPKPAAMAVAAATRLVDASRSLGAMTHMPTGAFGYSFMLSDKSHAITALWAHNGSFNANVPYQFQLNAPSSTGAAVVFDAMGNPSNVQYTDGKLQLTLSEMPIYVLSSNISALQPQLRAPEGYIAQP